MVGPLALCNGMIIYLTQLRLAAQVAAECQELTSPGFESVDLFLHFSLPAGLKRRNQPEHGCASLSHAI